MAAKKTSYVPRPSAAPSTLSRLDVVMRVQTGQLTVTEGAEELGLSRNRFQSLMHRALEAMLGELDQKPGGRPSKDPRLSELEEKNRRLELEKEALSRRASTSERVIANLADMVREQNGLPRPGRARSTKAKKTTAAPSDDADEDGPHELERAMKLVGLGLTKELAARAVGSSTSTLRRRARRRRAGVPLLNKRGPGLKPKAPEVLCRRAAKRVRAVRGLIGADALSRAVPGLSRREAARVKEATLIAMERERKERAARVTITVPGVVRGFDAMFINTIDGRRYPLVSADAAIPFRTSITACASYDAQSVACALEADFLQSGPPLVVRLDRCAAHTAPEVIEVTRRFGVLLLQGPPYHAPYYGQLERQNREHRAWLDLAGDLDDTTLSIELGSMRESLNTLIPRRTLNWCTPSDLWNTRRVIDDDRAALREEVDDRAAYLRRRLDEKSRKLGYDQRFAIEEALKCRGYLEQTTARWC